MIYFLYFHGLRRKFSLFSGGVSFFYQGKTPLFRYYNYTTKKRPCKQFLSFFLFYHNIFFLFAEKEIFLLKFLYFSVFVANCFSGGAVAVDKYSDNKLAEEFDLIILLKDKGCAKKGSVGKLIQSYTGKHRPMFALFSRVEIPLYLKDFRVLNPSERKDLQILSAYLKTQKAV